MAAGLSDKAIYGRVYRRLRGILRDLYERYGDACNMRYANRELAGEIKGVAVRVYYSILRASNGECAGLPCVEMRSSLYGEPVAVRLPMGEGPVEYLSKRI